MQKFLGLLIPFIILFLNPSFGEDSLPNKIVIKFKQANWENLVNTKCLQKILGNYSYENAINPKLIDFAQNKLRNQYKKSLPTTEIPFENLRKILIFTYDREINPVVLSRKLERLDFIEYAEPIPIHKLFFIPNDPDILSQYHLYKIQTFEAWDLLNPNADTIVVGVVDTGVDYLHPDLASNIWINPGETGLDEKGNDKRTNGIDDDNNGFADDYIGWDFCGADNLSPDNDPIPGNGHGTHVAGIIGAVINNALGISGIVPKVKIMPVKVSNDNPFGSSITKGYEGIFYAAVMGAKVINCSWGSRSASRFENEIVQSATKLGSCIVAAAGNDYTKADFIPASLNGVLSVAAVDSNDVKADFSNFSEKVAVSAPGVKVLSTVPNEGYAAWSGTSMASPVAAGVVALARQQFPNLNFEQIFEVVKKSTDNIDSLNPSYVGLIGTGRVNALKTVTINPDTLRGVAIENYSITEENNNGLFESDEIINIGFSVRSIFSDLESVTIKILPNQYISELCKDSIFIPIVYRDKTTETSLICFKLRKEMPFDYNLTLRFEITNPAGLITTTSVTIPTNPSFLNMTYNNIKATFNSRGNIGFNDYPDNLQGIGFVWQNKPNLLFEGALMLALNNIYIFDVARSTNQLTQNKDFAFNEKISLQHFPEKKLYLASVDFSPKLDSIMPILINEKIYQFYENNDSNFIIIEFTIKNNSNINYDSVYLGLFFDFDISLNASFDQVAYDLNYDFGYCKSYESDTLPVVGVKLLYPNSINFYAIDNPGSKDDSLSIYDGFTKGEKLKTLTNKFGRIKSNVTDASMVISCGPIDLKSNEEKRIVFSLFAHQNLFELKKESIKTKVKAIEFGLIPNENHPKLAETKDFIVSVYPNPVFEFVTINISFINSQPFIIKLYDLKGKVFDEVKENNTNLPNFEYRFDFTNLNDGDYFISFETPNAKKVFKIVKIKN